MNKKKILYIILGIISFIFLILCYKSCTIIDGGYYGVERNLGKILPEVRNEGLNFHPFWNSIQEVSGKIQGVSQEETSASKDIQTVKAKIVVNYFPVSKYIPELVRSLGELKAVESVFFSPLISSTFKSVTARYNAEELISKRSQVATEVSTQLKKELEIALSKRNLKNGIEITNVTIVNFQFSDDFSKAIESKQVAEQKAAQAINEKKRIETEADAEAYKIKTIANAEAEAINVRGKALKDNPDVIQLEGIQKWNGILPQYLGGNAVPFINVK
jgi:regulator of protease activity HflC (stomatin/prohibitin superfamily)